jgi:hypothetical protein
MQLYGHPISGYRRLRQFYGEWMRIPGWET